MYKCVKAGNTWQTHIHHKMLKKIAKLHISLMILQLAYRVKSAHTAGWWALMSTFDKVHTISILSDD